jgi:putative transposase
MSAVAGVNEPRHHHVSLELSRRFGTVVLEDLNTKGMIASAKGTLDEPGCNVRQKAGLNRSILNQSWHRAMSETGVRAI